MTKIELQTSFWIADYKGGIRRTEREGVNWADLPKEGIVSLKLYKPHGAKPHVEDAIKKIESILEKVKNEASLFETLINVRDNLARASEDLRKGAVHHISLGENYKGIQYFQLKHGAQMFPQAREPLDMRGIAQTIGAVINPLGDCVLVTVNSQTGTAMTLSSNVFNFCYGKQVNLELVGLRLDTVTLKCECGKIFRWSAYATEEQTYCPYCQSKNVSKIEEPSRHETRTVELKVK